VSDKPACWLAWVPLYQGGVIAPFPTQRWNEEALEAQGDQRFAA
jgi:hypothetical protein